MPATGYPDYQRVTFDAGNQFLNVNQPITVTGYLMAITPCSNWESISVYCQAPAGSDFYRVTCVFCADPQGNTIVTQPGYVVGPNFRAIKSFPVEGPYFAVWVFVKAGNNNTPIKVVAYGGAANVSSVTWDFFDSPLCLMSTSLATGASALTSSSTGTHGPASVAFDTGSTKNYRCAILYYDFVQGKFINLYLFYGADIGRGAIVNVYLPLTPLQFYTQNIDPATQVITMNVLPGVPGA